MATSDAEMGDSTSQVSAPESSQFPGFSWTGSPDSPVAVDSTRSGRGSKKRTQTATETWAHAKKLKLDEQARRDRAGNRIWVCGKCSWKSASLTSARNHLAHRHARCPSNQLFQPVGQSSWPIGRGHQPILEFPLCQPTNLRLWLVGWVDNPSNFLSNIS
jgi:ribosomal protein L37AE/L43A